MNGESSSEPSRGGENLVQLTAAAKIELAALVWWDYLAVSVGLRRESLATLVRRLRTRPRVHVPGLAPSRLGRIVHRVLRVGPYRPRCLVLSLVLLRILRRRGTTAELVIGLAPGARSHEAHAWVEVEGEDVGPPPGRMAHGVLARYGG